MSLQLFYPPYYFDQLHAKGREKLLLIHFEQSQVLFNNTIDEFLAKHSSVMLVFDPASRSCVQICLRSRRSSGLRYFKITVIVTCICGRDE